MIYRYRVAEVFTISTTHVFCRLLSILPSLFDLYQSHTQYILIRRYDKANEGWIILFLGKKAVPS